ncbi:hypothetical protein KKF82_06130, partial [Patescibacteria group bacterium]|nr:hypothetical protein [Patescibacteria group bacterium]
MEINNTPGNVKEQLSQQDVLIESPKIEGEPSAAIGLADIIKRVKQKSSVPVKTSDLSEIIKRVKKTEAGEPSAALPGLIQYGDIAGDSKYDYGVPFSMLDKLPQVRAERQSGGKQFINFLHQAVVGKFIGGMIEDVGYIVNALTGGELLYNAEQGYGNYLSDIGLALGTWTEEVSPIYEAHPGEFNPGSWSWWMANATSLGSTLAFIIPTGLAIRGLSAIARLANVGMKMGKAARWIATGLTQAGVSRFMEAHQESMGTFTEIYDSLIQKGVPEEQARMEASKGAAMNYNLNWVAILQDFSQYLLLNRAFKASSLANTSKILKRLGKTALPVVGKRTAAVAWDMAGEGGEEFYQYITNKESRYLAEVRAGVRDSSELPDRLKGYMKEGDFWTSGFWGMMGAGIFQTAGRSINRLAQGRDQLNAADKQLLDIESWGPQIKLYADNIRNARESGTAKEEEITRKAAVAGMGLKAAMAGNTQNIVDMMTTMKNPSQEELDHFGVDPADLEVMVDDFDYAINTFQEIGKKFDANNKKYSSDIASLITGEEVLLERNDDSRRLISEEAEQAKSKIINFDKLSKTGQEITVKKSTLEQKKSAIATLKKELDVAETPKKEDRDVLNKFIEFYNEEIKDLSNEIKELEKKRSPEEKKADKKINISSTALERYNNALLELEYLDADIKMSQKKLEIYKSPEFAKEIKKARKKRAKEASKKAVKEAKTSEEVKDIVDETAGTVAEEDVKDVVDETAGEQTSTSTDIQERYFKKPALFRKEYDEFQAEVAKTEDIHLWVKKGLTNIRSADELSKFIQDASHNMPEAIAKLEANNNDLVAVGEDFANTQLAYDYIKEA